MNQLVTLTPGGVAVTTSLAIADGTENEHRAVLQLIRTHLQDLEDFGRVAFEMRPFETAGGSQNREVAFLNQEQATLLLTHMRSIGVVKEFKKALVKAFFELARREQDPVQRLLTMSRPEMLEMAAGLAREKQALATKVQAQSEELASVQPKVAFHDQVAATADLQSIQEVAKTLGTGPTRFFAWLRAQNILFGQECQPYMEYLERGYFQVRTGTRIDDRGRDRAWSRTYFTGKGLIWIQKRWIGMAS